MGIVWIASYPKSGNTWVRFLLANYLAGPITESGQVEAAIPGLEPKADIKALLAAKDPLYIKTHFPWSQSHPFAAHSDKAIVVVRNPKDILLSNLNYHRMLSGSENGFTDDQYVQAFIHWGGDPTWIKRAGYGTLEDHIASWLDNPSAPPRLVVRYEDLIRDAVPELTRIVAFLGLPHDDAKVRRAAADSTFDQMRAIEVRDKAWNRAGLIFPGPAPRPGWSRFFMNRGRAVGSLAHIDSELDHHFDQRFASLMHRLGYASSAA